MNPATLGRYKIVGVLGRGGMGVVYEGHDPQIDRPVAIKTIALEALSAEEQAMFESRFRSEMRSAGRLQHHNIAALYDTGRDGGTAYIVMELVKGSDLKRHLAAGERFSITQAVDITVQLLTALEFAHRHQVIHRDVKPANVMLQADGLVKLCDFGVARLADADATRTQGMVVGSLSYASPEQITGLPIDERTDIYATGVLLFEMLTGELPFKGQSDVETLHRIATNAAPSPRALNHDVPADVDAAVLRALSKDPAARFGSAAEFARALGASSIGASDTRPLLPLPPSPSQPSTKPAAPSRGLRRWLPAAIAGLGLALAAAWWTLQRESPAPSVAQVPAQAPLAPPASATARAADAAESSLAVPAIASTQGPQATLATQAPPAAPAATTVQALPGPAERPADGVWQGRLQCDPSHTPGFTGPGSEAFNDDVLLTLAGSRITWVRSGKTLTETAAGNLDAQAHFVADGEGALKDGLTSWQLKATGDYDPKARRINARAQLLRKADGFVTRQCTLVAAQGGQAAVVAAKAPPVPASLPVAARTPAPASSSNATVAALQRPASTAVPQGAWAGELSCGALLNAPRNALRVEPFTAKVKVEVAGLRFGWVRESKTAYESASGNFDPAGRFTAAGNGGYKDDAQRNPWRVNAEGEYRARDQRIEAQVQLSRVKDGTLSRECTLRASRP